MLKAMLAQSKIHIPTQALERAIIMPRDLDNYHPAYPKISDFTMFNPYKDSKVVGKKKKAKKVDESKKGLLRGGAGDLGDYAAV